MRTKAIVFGKLEFNHQKGFEQALKMCQQRHSHYFKGQSLLKIDQVFDESNASFTIHRIVKEDFEKKQWKNTIDFIQYVSEFAIAGSVSAFFFEEGNLKKSLEIEPVGDKSAIQSFRQGCQAIQENNTSQALQDLNQAINKFDKHAPAYERRGYVYFELGCLNEAEEDYNKSIEINAICAKPYFGKALVAIAQKRYEDAVKSLDQATKNAIAHQPLHWEARRIKGDCHLQLKEYEKAAFEYKLFTTRKFQDNDPNKIALKQALFNFGQSLDKQGKVSEAADAFKKAKNMKGALDAASEAMLLEYGAAK
ncbi:MAG: tetratricopeptide repeat protein [Saprospiraceae bacterium]|nr:tetratricopeptide repeat protein [Saprospiraceae bacterium]